ncbi:MAG: hypothetical protein V3V02_00985 [Rhizobiaceae bacterium]
MNKTLRTILVLLALGYGLKRCYFPSYSWYQKLTLVWETPTGLVSGSSVLWVQWRGSPKFLPDVSTVSARVIGEAAVVDFGKGRYIFALISNASTMALAAFASPSSTGKRITRASEVNDHHGETKEISRTNVYLPLMVTFTDINDPASVKKIDPYYLDSTFGCTPAEKQQAEKWREKNGTISNQGATFPNAKNCYKLKSVTLEITDEPMTKGVVEGVLGWLGWPRDKLLKAGGGRNPVRMLTNGKLRTLARTAFRKK